MSLEELKSQVESAVRQLFSALSSREHEALRFVLGLLRRCVLDGDSPAPAEAPGAAEDLRAASPDQLDYHSGSPPPSPEREPPPKRTAKDPEKASILKGLSTSFSELAQRIRKRKRSFVRCFVCTDWAGPRLALVQHVASHAGAAASCRACRHSFGNLAALSLHRELGECAPAPRPPPGALVFRRTRRLDQFDFTRFSVCPFCAMRFSKASNVRTHMRRSVCARRAQCEPSAKCAHCHKDFGSDGTLREHVEKVHTHKCSRCQELFPTVVLMRAHRQTCRAANHIVHKCSECSQSFAKRTELRTHRREAHKDTKKRKKKPVPRHACAACGWRTSRAYNLRRHERARGHGAGAGAAPPLYACHRCPVLLRSVTSLNNHLVAHNEEKKYVCAHCDKGFHYKAVLKRHLGRHEPAGAPLACARCRRAFPRRDHLLRHQREVHDNRRKHRVRPSKAQKGGGAGGAAGAAAGAQEPQFLSLLDVQSGEMFTVPSHLAYNLLCQAPQPEWSGGAGEPTLLPAADNIVLLTNVPDLLQTNAA